MQLRLLGPMAVIAEGKPLPLPASRKTRALLGYLAAEGKPVRRERLCHLFWEIPDDPKGALRWSLSKLRGLLGGAIVADRETAALDLSGLDIDYIELKAAAANLAATPTERLEQICASASGGLFMCELDLPNCDDFNAWRRPGRAGGGVALRGARALSLEDRYGNEPPRFPVRQPAPHAAGPAGE